MKKIRNIYLTCLITSLFIFILCLYLNDIFPFGNNMLGKYDAIYQFKPMLYNFIMKLKTGTILNYTFNNGLGNPLTFDLIYYYSSPLNLISILFNKPNTMYLISTLIRIAISSISMTFYTSKKTNNKIIIFIATIAYVYSSWFITYYYYLPWLDVYMILPLFQYGLEQLLNNHKYHIYIFTLSYMIMTNLYLCFSVCIYTIIFFIIYELLYKKETIKKKILTFDYIALSTIGSFLLSFISLYIWYDSILKAKLAIDSNILNSYNVLFLDFLKSLYYGNTNHILTMVGNTFPNIACSFIIMISSIHFFFNKMIDKRKKIFAVIGLIIIIAIIYIPKIDFIMNAFHSIRGLTFRYSFIICFLMICLSIEDGKNSDKRLYFPIFIILVIIYFFIRKRIEITILIIQITFMICYGILIVLFNKYKYYKYLFILLFLLEIIVISNINIPAKENYDKQTTYNKENVKYRITNNFDTENLNYNLYNNTKVTYLLTSITYNKIFPLMSNMGCSTFENTSITCSNKDKITELLLNVKNRENDYYLEKIYSVNKKIKETQLDEYDIKSNIENIIFNMTGIKDIYNKEVLKAKTEKDKYIFNTNHDYYLIEVKNENGGINTIPQEYKVFNQEKKYGDGTATIYTVKEDKLKDIYNSLRKNQIEYKYYNDNHMIGNINVDKDQIIFTSIPYDKDWEVYIDGEKVKTIELLDSLLGIEVKPGIHKIELKYKTHYLIPILISISTLIVLIIDLIRKRILNH